MPRLAQIAVLAGIMLSTGTARAVGYICIAGLTGFSLLAADSSSLFAGCMLFDHSCLDQHLRHWHAQSLNEQALEVV